MQPINEKDDPVFSTSVPNGLSAAQRALLRTIHGSESAYPGRDPYTVMYGGKTISDFSDHPRRYWPIANGPNRGNVTSAAGGYQFLGRSWDEAAKPLGLTDFSPSNQDRAALWHAEKAYRGRTGRDLYADIEAAGGDPQRLTQIGRGLSGWWTSLPGGIEPNPATRSFGDRFSRQWAFANDEGDTDKPALYSALAFSGDPKDLPKDGSTKMPFQFNFGPRQPPLVPPAGVTPGVSSRPAPVDFTDDPLTWLRGGNSAGYSVPNGLLGAAAGLAAVNNPKGASVYQGMIDDPEEWTTHLDKDGNFFQANKRGDIRQIPNAMKKPDVPELEKVDAPTLKNLHEAHSTAGPGANASERAVDLIKDLDEGRLKPDFINTWLTKGSSVFEPSSEEGRIVRKLERFRNELALARQLQQKGPQTDKDYERIQGTFADALSRYDPVAIRDALAESIKLNKQTSYEPFRSNLDASRYANPKADPRVFNSYEDFRKGQDKLYGDWDAYEAARPKATTVSKETTEDRKQRWEKAGVKVRTAPKAARTGASGSW